ncbi:putative disease resistance protein [Sesamum alatum]|uniref:Disease resistance protein n=1 Tax=Sesamum alatum TaxID=300844 RepID=A0AAE1YD42_9LAMI|nr:putative disease resistance protein [Sesamum alatum]
MVDAALEFTIHNLREKFRETFVLEHDVTEKIRQIAKSVQLLRSHLSDAQVTQASGGMMTIYERDIREIIQWFDRVQQKFAIVAASGGGRLSRFFKRLVPVGLKDLREIYIDIRKAEYRVDYFIRLFEESIRRRSYAQLTGESSRAASYLSKRSLRREEGFVGMEEEVEVLWSCIKEPQIRVIGICGMGGLGKTTLASRLFQDKRVRSLFPHLAWVFVSPDFEPRRIFEDVLKQLGVVYPEESVADMNAAEMARRLYNVQQEVPCLIVLDDLWSADGWRALSVAFPSGDTRSKILITTRVGQVVETAEIAAARRYIHKTRCLNPDEGWQLFMKTIGNQDLITDMGVVEMVGQKMVKYCEGLPLAIMNFADHFLRQRQEPSDESMQDERYIQSVVRDSQEEGSILESLALSYNNLPHFLRHCFLYLGHFQEHSPIQAEKLYLFWLAEGLLSLEDCGEEETLLNVADRYLDELAQRSMIEVHEEEVPTVTRFSSCQLRQPIRDLCLVKNKDEGYFRFVDFRNESQTVRGLSSSYRLHINLDGYEHGHGFRLKDAEKKEMRCLLISAKENQKELVWPHDLSSLVKFKYLRVLDFMGISFQGTQTLEGIGKLVHLMYLSFEDCTLPELPSSIGKLELLCVLDLRVINTMIIPDVLWKLKKLKHLYFPESFGTHGARKLRLDGLTDLETVINLNLNMCNVRDLFKLYNLRYVGLNVPGYLEEIEHIV